ncbi:M23 family metallopeptidase [Oleiharenicola lentus]|uniref:M23 family metallopeptidase n=1 Tax=Oleiharenicola lentus TaxID=2508720 RepID=UPI003F675D37
MIFGLRIFWIFACISVTLVAQRIDISWPTPNRAWEQGKSYDAWVQPTVSGQLESGLFGSVRSNGTQFHEGLDIRPVTRDSKGEAADKVTAAMSGVVRHVSISPGNSSYGRYIVIEHPDVQPAVYTLYAHLAKVEPGIARGKSVKQGQVLATMGRSAGGYAIPKDRAHLHFEIGLVGTENFQAWYNWRKFGSPNQHGDYNGMNLLGLDPMDFLSKWRTRKVDNFDQYFSRMDSAVRFRIVTSRRPDFIVRYPALLKKEIPLGLIGGWEVQLSVTGLPFSWTPLTPAEVAGKRAGSVEILEVDNPALRRARGKTLVRPKGSGYIPGSDMTTILQLVFGQR